MRQVKLHRIADDTRFSQQAEVKELPPISQVMAAQKLEAMLYEKDAVRFNDIRPVRARTLAEIMVNASSSENEVDSRSSMSHVSGTVDPMDLKRFGNGSYGNLGEVLEQREASPYVNFMPYFDAKPFVRTPPARIATQSPPVPTPPERMETQSPPILSNMELPSPARSETPSEIEERFLTELDHVPVNSVANTDPMNEDNVERSSRKGCCVIS